MSTESKTEAASGIGCTDNTGIAELDFSRYFAMFPDPVLAMDTQGRVIFLNSSAEELLGCSVDSKTDHLHCNEIIKKEPEGEPIPFTQWVKAEKCVDRMAVRLRDRQGKWSSLAMTVSPIKNATGTAAGCLAILRDLEADLKTQPKVQSQIATLSSILDSFPTPFFTVDPNLVITHMNELMEKLTGYTREEVVGRMPCAEALCTEQCGTEACLLMQAMEHRRPIAGIRRVITNRDGKEIQVVVNASIITDPAGNVIGGFEAVRDISRRVEAEKKIELLGEMTQEGVLMADENHRVIFANPRMAEITGIPREEIVGLSVGELLSSQHDNMLSDLLSEPQPENQPHLRFCSTLQSDLNVRDSYRGFETCMAVSRVGQDRIAYLYLRDLTERIEIERELRKTNSFLHNIIQSSVDGIVVVDTRGNVLVFNEGAEHILGYTAAEVIGNRELFRKFYDPDLAREMMRRMRSNEYGPPGKVNPIRISFTGKSGEEVPVKFSAAIIMEGGREIGSVGIFSDLREEERMRKELNHLRENERIRRELEDTQRQLLQAEKISSLGRLAAGVAHEINNPLAGVLIYADMLMKEIGGNEQCRQDLEEIISQTLRCKQIVARLLEFSRQSLDQRVHCDVNEVIGHCVELLEHQAMFHNIEIVENLEKRLPQVLGNPGELEQVFTNLMLNAADAMEGKGRLTISSKSDQEAEQVILKLTDTGPGISAENMEKIFEPFFTTKPVGVGTGLGLSVVYGVVQRHGGSIEAESPPGRGATFMIRLPVESPFVISEEGSESGATGNQT